MLVELISLLITTIIVRAHERVRIRACAFSRAYAHECASARTDMIEKVLLMVGLTTEKKGDGRRGDTYQQVWRPAAAERDLDRPNAPPAAAKM